MYVKLEAADGQVCTNVMADLCPGECANVMADFQGGVETTSPGGSRRG